MKPEKVFEFFKQINAVPRPSKKEEKMMAYLKEVAEKYNLDYKEDDAGNVLISVPASPGCENKPGVILQGHMDMVCEKEKSLDFDFDTQPIQTYVEGDWMKAKGTTLGADDGIGVAMALALAIDPDVKHGPMECLFTKDEESGMTGAFGLKPGFLKGKYLINLDSEDEGEFFIGCAGGENTNASFVYDTLPLENGYIPISVEIDNLSGGHSGDEINKKRANAIKLLSRFLYLTWSKYDAKLIPISGGKLHNAIPRFAEAVIAVPFEKKEQLRVDFNVFAAQVEDEYHVQEKNMRFSMTSCHDESKDYIQPDVAWRLITCLQSLHNGILEMNQDIDGLVETSSNLAAVKQDGQEIKVLVSQRSSSESGLDNISNTIAAAFKLAGANVVFSDRYPGWKPNPNTTILNVSVEAYKELFGKSPVVRAIHAGLECGLFSTKYPDVEMISFGPTLRDVHSPKERLLIPTVEMTWDLLVKVVEKLS